jgi:hypothetical protein
VKITLNLGRALRGIIRMQKKHSWDFCFGSIKFASIRQMIWKVHQIAMMGDIYRAASAVIIYLGEPMEETVPLLEELYRWNESIPRSRIARDEDVNPNRPTPEPNPWLASRMHRLGLTGKPPDILQGQTDPNLLNPGLIGHHGHLPDSAEAKQIH